MKNDDALVPKQNKQDISKNNSDEGQIFAIIKATRIS